MMTKLIPLTQGKFAIVDDDDFKFLMNYKWYATEGANGVFYAKRLSASIKMHHVIAGRPIRNKMIDHKNGNGLDNRRVNLRIVSNRQNCQNLSIKKKSKFVGVSLDKRTCGWYSFIKIQGKTHNLGYFKKEEDARDAYIFACNLIGQPVIT
jgi:hypothetical protein